ncbi:hypothetical protein DVH24_029221 [Malus domestica]|uniref:Uncharacterized protein n=1 Tax=Malus domestica TaxID=3750 RepID=A0A498HUP9_MALDO|nr:hypothetical protein DVH24_029221 [Malus domestica]
MLQFTRLRGMTSSSAHFRSWIGSDIKLSHPAPGPHHIPGSTPPPRPRPHGFVSGNSHENFPVGHPSWDWSRTNSFNFGVLMEPEVSELPKGLVLGSDENTHIRLRGYTPLDNVS